MSALDLVAVTPYGPRGGSSRVRIFDWLDYLKITEYSISSYIGESDAGVGTLMAQPFNVLKAETSLRAMARRPTNRLLLHREASPFSRGHVETKLLRNASHSVYDFDDALQWDSPRSMGTRIFPKQAKCIAAVCNADRVVAGNEVLADWASAHATDVRVIPSCVDPSRYQRKSSFELHDPPRLVWIGSPATEQYITSVAGVLKGLHERTGARLTVISKGSQNLQGLEHMLDRQDWHATDFSAQLVQADIAIAPLSSTEYARGKCAYKVLQYAAVGLPCIVSPVGANITAAKRFDYAMPTTDSEWTDCLEQLLSMSSFEREEVGTGAQRSVQKHYSFESWAPAWMAAQNLP